MLGIALGYESKGEKTVPLACPRSGLRMRRFRLSGKTRFDDSGSEIFAIENGEPSHRIVRRRVNAHGCLVGILSCDPLIHVEEVAIALADHLKTLLVDDIGKIQVHDGPHSPTPRSSSHTAFTARDARSRGKRSPKRGYRRSRK